MDSRMKTVIPNTITKKSLSQSHSHSNDLSHPYNRTNHSAVNGAYVTEPGSIVEGVVVNNLELSATTAFYSSSSQPLSAAALSVMQDGNIIAPSLKVNKGSKDESVLRNGDRDGDKDCDGYQNTKFSPKGDNSQNVCVVTINGHENLEKSLSHSSIFLEGKIDIFLQNCILSSFIYSS